MSKNREQIKRLELLKGRKGFILMEMTYLILLADMLLYLLKIIKIKSRHMR